MYYIFLLLVISLFAGDVLVNFPLISMQELVKFASRVGGVNFVGDPKLLDFEVSLLSGKPIPPP